VLDYFALFTFNPLHTPLLYRIGALQLISRLAAECNVSPDPALSSLRQACLGKCAPARQTELPVFSEDGDACVSEVTEGPIPMLYGPQECGKDPHISVEVAMPTSFRREVRDFVLEGGDESET
jgi:hypothetical protein